MCQLLTEPPELCCCHFSYLLFDSSGIVRPHLGINRMVNELVINVCV